MRGLVRAVSGAMMLFGLASLSCHREPPASVAGRAAVIVQPGAPGKESRVLTAATVGTPPPPDRPANGEFMQGMIQHHEQALEMVDLLETRTTNPAIRLLAKKMAISQTQEIRKMQTWLTRRGQPIPGVRPNASAVAPMPGMLTPQQMAALAASSGAAFDRLFLTDMIQHHIGALTMVQQLFATPGAGQDPALFAFASGVDNDQRVEIARMRQMLEEMQ
jgi:uncharacterized protein (DUF305 family)